MDERRRDRITMESRIKAASVIVALLMAFLGVICIAATHPPGFIIYLLTPFVVPFLWYRNGSRVSRELETTDLPFSRATRAVLCLGAGIGIVAFVGVFVVPSILISLAIWLLPDLTARVFAEWSIVTLLGVVNIGLSGRRSAMRYLMRARNGRSCPYTSSCAPHVGRPRPRQAHDLYFIGGVVPTLLVFSVIHLALRAAVLRAMRSAGPVTHM